MQKKRILFFGTPQIAVPALETLSHLDEYEIVGVGTFPDRPVGRGQELQPSPVKDHAQRHNLPIYEIESKQQVRDLFEHVECDIAIVIAFGVIFPEDILGTPEQGVMNVHFSLLPKYRGASPVQSAILCGDSTSGITFQRMVKELDAGDILWQKEYDISDKSTSDLFSFFAVETGKHIHRFLDELFAGKLQATPQDASQATICGKFKKSDGEVFPDTETAEQIYRKYLAFDIWPRIYMQTGKGKLKIHNCSLEPKEDAVELTCALDTTLYIYEAQLEGKTRNYMSEILKGNPNILH